MIRILIPLILVATAVGSFIVYTNPAYQDAKKKQVEERSFDELLTKAEELQKLRNTLISRFNTFPPEDVRRLERLLPDHVDNIRLVIDIDNIASRYNLRVRNVALRSSAKGAGRSAAAVGSPSDAIGSVDLSFTVASSYEDFTRFLRDLEKSLRIVDVMSLSFRAGEGEINDYSVNIRTYWLH